MDVLTVVKNSEITAELIANQISFNVLASDYGKLEHEIERLENEKALLKAAILKKFDKVYGFTSYTFTSPETGDVLQRIIQVTQTIDQGKIRKLLTPTQFAKVAVSSVDKEKLLAAIQLGDIKPAKVAPAIITKTIDKLAYRKINK